MVLNRRVMDFHELTVAKQINAKAQINAKQIETVINSGDDPMVY